MRMLVCLVMWICLYLSLVYFSFNLYIVVRGCFRLDYGLYVFGHSIFRCFHQWIVGFLNARTHAWIHMPQTQPVVCGWFSFSTIALQQTLYWQCHFKWHFGCSDYLVAPLLQIIFILLLFFTSILASVRCVCVWVSNSLSDSLFSRSFVHITFWRMMKSFNRFYFGLNPSLELAHCDCELIPNESSNEWYLWVERISYKRVVTIRRTVRKLFIP